MKEINPYLTFDGNAREAMTFYKDCFGAELHMSSFSEMPGPSNFPEEAKNRIMHARLTKGSIVLMASDMPPGMAFQQGNNFSISISCESRQETEELFVALGKNGTVTMPLQDVFWGAYFGMLKDQFGVSWMFNFENPKEG